MNYECYHIPVNFTDAGRLFGAFDIRNTVEMVVLCLPILFLCVTFLPFSLTWNIIWTMTILVPLGGFALIGIHDDSLARFLTHWRRFHKRRRILSFRGGSI